MKKQPLLIDLDLDFLWNKDYYGYDGYSRCDDHNAKVAYPSELVANRLLALKKRDTQVHLVVDHHESLYVWDELKVKKACCIHIDAHHDMWAEYQTLKAKHRQNVGCGNFLAQAIIDHIVNEVIYVTPKFKTVFDEEQDIMYEFDENLEGITVMTWRSFSRTMHQLPKADVITIAISPEWSPRSLWPHMEEVCTILGVGDKSIACCKKQADKKWDIIERPLGGPVAAEKFDFKFPYKKA